MLGFEQEQCLAVEQEQYIVKHEHCPAIGQGQRVLRKDSVLVLKRYNH